ncbi:MAG: cupin domain-containing protein [Pseudomonadota bacterium]
MSTPDLIVRADAVAEGGFAFRHPLDPSKGCTMMPVSRMAGMKASAVNLVRIAPGEQAFPLHVHHGEEEWVYVISGTGEVMLDQARHAMGPGDFVAFPPGGPAHAMVNTGADEMVCLMGSDLTTTDVIEAPELGKRITRFADRYEAAPIDTFKTIMPGKNEGESQ